MPNNKKNGYANFLYACKEKSDDPEAKFWTFSQLQAKFAYAWDELDAIAKASYKSSSASSASSNRAAYKARKAEEQASEELAELEKKREIANLIASECVKHGTHLNFNIIEVTKWFDGGDGIPAEIAIVRVNSADGKQQTFHRLIAHGEIPVGHRSDMQQLSELRHKMPVGLTAVGTDCDSPETNFGRGDYEAVLRETTNFAKPKTRQDFGSLRMRKHPGAVPTVFAMPAQIEAVETALRWLFGSASNAAARNLDMPIQVFDLVDLLASLTGAPYVSVRGRLTKNLSVLYEPNYKCAEFHFGLDDNNAVCALGRAQMLASLFSKAVNDIVDANEDD